MFSIVIKNETNRKRQSDNVITKTLDPSMTCTREAVARITAFLMERNVQNLGFSMALTHRTQDVNYCISSLLKHREHRLCRTLRSADRHFPFKGYFYRIIKPITNLLFTLLWVKCFHELETERTPWLFSRKLLARALHYLSWSQFHVAALPCASWRL